MVFDMPVYAITARSVAARAEIDAVLIQMGGWQIHKELMLGNFDLRIQ
jgi:hypothetical protein